MGVRDARLEKPLDEPHCAEVDLDAIEAHLDAHDHRTEDRVPRILSPVVQSLGDFDCSIVRPLLRRRVTTMSRQRFDHGDRVGEERSQPLNDKTFQIGRRNALTWRLAISFFGLRAGEPRDYAQAVVWYRKAADQGDAAAQNNLGRMYDHGQGVLQDYAQAVVWLRKAAEQGNALGQVNLGTMYDHGHGAPQDYVQAHMWYNLAASHAEDAATREMAVKNRDEVAAKMTPAQLAEAQRLASEWKPK